MWATSVSAVHRERGACQALELCVTSAQRAWHLNIMTTPFMMQLLEALDEFWYQHYLPAQQLLASHPDTDKRTLARWLHELKPGAYPQNRDLLQACSSEMHKSVQHVGTV